MSSIKKKKKKKKNCRFCTKCCSFLFLGRLLKTCAGWTRNDLTNHRWLINQFSSEKLTIQPRARDAGVSVCIVNVLSCVWLSSTEDLPITALLLTRSSEDTQMSWCIQSVQIDPDIQGNWKLIVAILHEDNYPLDSYQCIFLRVHKFW